MTMHIMVDLETMGTRPGSAIISIGAVAFDPVAGLIGREFYRNVSLASCVSVGLKLDADTVVWWMKQSEEARAALAQGADANLRDVLAHFTGWWTAEARGARIWGHGGNFDEPILRAAYEAVNRPVPWAYWDARCTRTIYELAGVKPERSEGVHHNALDDARAQAKAVITAYGKLGLQGQSAEPADA